MVLAFLTGLNDILWNYLVLGLLLSGGIFFSIRLRFVQIFYLKPAIRELLARDKATKNQISSFQALCTSLAQRVGTGNLAGVATALSSGGEGAIFWMWITALLGASTSFAECTLAQVFKIKNPNGAFLGGPAYYIQAGLRSKLFAVIFSIAMILSMGFVLNGVQSNTIAQGLHFSLHLDPAISGLFIALAVSLVIFGGIKRISQVAEVLVPFMALFYLGLVGFVVLTNFDKLPDIFFRIIDHAFSPKAAMGGFFGHTVKEAFRYGVARGLYSNEAGWGSAPNAAASANVRHPVQQGLVQMVAVYIDTLLICTATALLILLAPANKSLTGIALTSQAATYHFGPIGHFFIGTAMILFGFTTILGNAFYGEVNIRYLSENQTLLNAYRLFVILAVFTGALSEVQLIWQMTDVMSGFMTIINMVSIILLSGIVMRTFTHYKTAFLPHQDPFIMGKIGLKIIHTDFNFAFQIDKKDKSKIS